VVIDVPQQGETFMKAVVTIGLDLAKRVFQVHGVDAAGATIVRKKLRRSEVMVFFAQLPPCRIGLEACATAHYWARELQVLGHEVRLMPPQYVKAYLKRHKNDAADAEAICEAVQRPNMRFVPVKSAEQQSVLVLHRSRDLLVRQRTALVNALRAHLAEFGIVEAQGLQNVGRLGELIEDEADPRVPELARAAARVIVQQIKGLNSNIDAITVQIRTWHATAEVSRRLATIPGIGALIASALAATVPNPRVFASSRAFAAWLGLVPRQNSSGGKDRLGRISKQGNGDLRRLLIIGAQAALLRSKMLRAQPWVAALLARKPRLVVAVALANKIARIAWAVMTRGDTFRTAAA
jgi:transposase